MEIFRRLQFITARGHDDDAVFELLISIPRRDGSLVIADETFYFRDRRPGIGMD